IERMVGRRSADRRWNLRKSLTSRSSSAMKSCFMREVPVNARSQGGEKTRSCATPDRHPAGGDQDAAIIITGAGSGIGRGLATWLAASGRRLVLVGRREQRLCDTADECVAAGASADRCLVVAADITDAAAVDHIVTASVRRYGGIYAIVNNAGL